MSMQAQSILIFVGTFLFSFLSRAYVFISPIERSYLKEWLTSSGDGAKAPPPKEEKSEFQKRVEAAEKDRKDKKKQKKKEASGEEGDQEAAEGEEEKAEDSEQEETEAEEAGESEEAEDQDAGEEDEEEVANTEEVKDSSVNMMKFLGGALEGLMDQGIKLDGVNRFGCHLFLAGAAEAQSRQSNLSHNQFVKVLEQCVSVLGTDKKMARQFGEKYEEYLLEPKYCDMFRAGGAAMERFFDDDEMNVATTLKAALESWNTSADKADAGAPMAVMFTDIVGSTKLTQNHGDDAMQKIVRAHNKIVRSELRNFAGTEVKHTGDGIMASFKSVANSVDASLAMMKGIDKFNDTAGDIPLQIRIGINAGTPIQEDGDLFGTTVQIAARLCDKADDGGIAVSNLVRELSTGRPAEFSSMGEMELKGVNESVIVYSVDAKG